MTDFKKRLKAALKSTGKIKYKKGGYIKPAGGGDQVVYGATHAQGGVDRNPQVELEGGGYTSGGQPKAGEVITTIYDNGGNPQEFYMSHKNGVAQQYLQAKAANGGSLPQQTKQEFAKLNESMNPDGSPSGVAANGGMNQYFTGGMGIPQIGGPIGPNASFTGNNQMGQAQEGFSHGGYHKRVEGYPEWLDKSVNWLRGGVEKSKESGVLNTIQSGADVLKESEINKSLQRGGDIMSVGPKPKDFYKNYVYNPDKFNAIDLHPLFSFAPETQPTVDPLVLSPYANPVKALPGIGPVAEIADENPANNPIQKTITNGGKTYHMKNGIWFNEDGSRSDEQVEPVLAGTSSSGSSKEGDANVIAQQNELIAQGYDLPKYGADGFIGDETNAAIAQRQGDIDTAAAEYSVSGEDLVWTKDGFVPKEGAVHSENGDIWKEGAWTDDDPDEGLYYDNEGNIITKEEFDKLNKDNLGKKEDKDKDKNSSFLDRIGVNNITDGIEILSIMKADRYAKEQNKKLGDLKVKSKKITPGAYTPETVDLADDKEKTSQLTVAAIKQGMQEGKSMSSIIAAVKSGQKELRSLSKTESELQKKQNNFAKKMNMDAKFKADVTNMTNDRLDQVANNDAMASMIKNNIALSQNMRNAISTKIKDQKLLNAAENEMMVINAAIAGGTGTDIRKGIPAIRRLMGNGTVSESTGNELITNLQNQWDLENSNVDGLEDGTTKGELVKVADADGLTTYEWNGKKWIKE